MTTDDNEDKDLTTPHDHEEVAKEEEREPDEEVVPDDAPSLTHEEKKKELVDEIRAEGIMTNDDDLYIDLTTPHVREVVVKDEKAVPDEEVVPDDAPHDSYDMKKMKILYALQRDNYEYYQKKRKKSL